MPNSKPTFATPLPQPPQSDILEWRFPSPYQNYVLTGKSRAAWHTSFVIPQLNLLLDAGLCVNNLRPKHIFLTHGHSDHTLLAPAFMKRADPPDVFCPEEMAGLLDGFVGASMMLNLGVVGADGGGGGDGESVDGEGDGGQGNGNGDEGPKQPDWFLKTHHTHGLKPGDTVSLRRLKTQVTATAFACDHTVPSLGYVFYSTTSRLLPQYAGLSPDRLRDLRKTGHNITGPHRVPVFAFLGDGTAATLAAEPEWLREGCRVVITECSFLYPEHEEAARRTKHTIWRDLEPVVRKWRETVFVVCHFSLRYSVDEVRLFFGQVDIPNLVVFI